MLKAASEPRICSCFWNSNGRERDNAEATARRAGRDAGRLLRARRLRPCCARHAATGGAVPRSLRRRHPPTHVSTTAPDGDEFCLRPDLTIPVSRDYLSSPIAGKPAGYCYLGPVFRHRRDAPAEFLQAGIESFGRADKAAADAEMLSLGLEATAHYGVAAPDIQIGDVALFASLVAGLDLPPAWKRRLIKDFNRKTNLAQDLDRLVAWR